MSYVLVTGCTGTIGRYVTRALLEAGHGVVGVAIEDTTFQSHPHFKYISLDISDEQGVREVLASHAFDCIVHLAALVHVRHKHLTFADYSRLNYRASQVLFRLGAQRGIQRIIFTSTIEVYGTTSRDQLVNEQAPCRPESDYARTKLLAEEGLAQLASDSNLRYAILRLAPVYATDFSLNVDKRLYIRKPIGYHIAWTDYDLALCSVYNVALFIVRWLAMEAPAQGVFNLADSKSYSVRALLLRERTVGRCKMTVHLPYAACMAALVALEAINSVAGREPGTLSVANLRKLVRSAKWDTKRAVESVGELPWSLETTLAANLPKSSPTELESNVHD
jgi:nucleoside-diphosphate-sugar epimerase